MPFVTVENADNVAPPRFKVALLRYSVLNLAVGLPKSNTSETVGSIVPETLVFPPIFKSPLIPTPPATVNAPVVVDVDVSVPKIAIDVPIIALRYDAIPPTTTSPPVIVLVEVNGPGDVIAAGVPRPTFNSDAIYE